MVRDNTQLRCSIYLRITCNELYFGNGKKHLKMEDILIQILHRYHDSSDRSTIATYTNTKHGLDLDKIMVKKYIEGTFAWTTNYGKDMAQQ